MCASLSGCATRQANRRLGYTIAGVGGVGLAAGAYGAAGCVAEDLPAAGGCETGLEALAVAAGGAVLVGAGIAVTRLRLRGKPSDHATRVVRRPQRAEEAPPDGSELQRIAEQDTAALSEERVHRR